MPDKTDEAKFYTEIFLFDRRLVERNKRKGLITQEEYERYLAALPDVSANIDLAEIPESGEASPKVAKEQEGEKPGVSPEAFSTEEGEYD